MPARYGAPQHVQPSSQCHVKTWEESKGEISGVGADAASDAAVRRELEVRICREAAKAFPVRTPRIFSASSPHAHHPPANRRQQRQPRQWRQLYQRRAPNTTYTSLLPQRTGSRPRTLTPVHVPVVRRGPACHGAPRHGPACPLRGQAHRGTRATTQRSPSTETLAYRRGSAGPRHRG